MLNTGVDILKINRIEKIFDEYGDEFLDRFFTKLEIEYIIDKKYKVETIAGIISSKESVSKSLGIGMGKIKWKEIEIFHDENGRPQVRILNEAYNKYKFSLSISHEKDYVVSFVISF